MLAWWLAGKGLYWRSVKKPNWQGHSLVFQICHLLLVYALKGLESGGKASNFTWGNVLGIRLFVFLSWSWDENKRWLMSPCFNETDLQNTPGQSHGNISGTTENKNSEESELVFAQICFLTLFIYLKSCFHSNHILKPFRFHKKSSQTWKKNLDYRKSYFSYFAIILTLMQFL